MGRQLYRGKEQEILHRLPVVSDIAAPPYGGPLGEGSDGKQTEMVWLLDHRIGGYLCLVRAQPNHIPLLYLE